MNTGYRRDRPSPIIANQPTNRPPLRFQVWFLRSLPNLFNLLFDLLVLVVVILTGVRDLVLEDLDELVEDNGNDGADCGAHPIDPVFRVEDASYDAGAEGAGRVERAASVVDAD